MPFTIVINFHANDEVRYKHSEEEKKKKNEELNFRTCINDTCDEDGSLT